MTKELIALHRCLGDGHSKRVILKALEECLNEIERLQEELEILKTEKRHLVNAAVKAIEDCRKRDLL